MLIYIERERKRERETIHTAQSERQTYRETDTKTKNRQQNITIRETDIQKDRQHKIDREIERLIDTVYIRVDRLTEGEKQRIYHKNIQIYILRVNVKRNIDFNQLSISDLKLLYNLYY